MSPQVRRGAADEAGMSWFERLLPLLDGMPTERLALMRDIINAVVERRRSTAPAHRNLESAVLYVCDERS